MFWLERLPKLTFQIKPNTKKNSSDMINRQLRENGM